ncbi:hypothetical protein KC19_5G138000 [Ceratodon purpureus]|uniref:Uncharacterized protein n=1 Tax=Ceratodon purpureus TaxID=3225 RepID=A0A8T0I2L7_CERPU|nr:hypothetical protein KC19_5G138000 [Ceratodon purpureus]
MPCSSVTQCQQGHLKEHVFNVQGAASGPISVHRNIQPHLRICALGPKSHDDMVRFQTAGKTHSSHFILLFVLEHILHIDRGLVSITNFSPSIHSKQQGLASVPTHLYCSIA